jgi:ribosomal protein S18 acetylase RimI-like enzyme
MSRRILIINNDIHINKNLRQILDKDCNNLVFLRSYHNILKVLNKDIFDLIVVNINSRSVDGFGAAQEIKEILHKKNIPTIPVIFFSDLNELNDRENEIFLRPIDINEFLKDIDNKKISFSVVQTSKELRDVVTIRKKIFVEREGYPAKSIVSDFDKSAVHILAKEGSRAIGTISLVLDSEKGLPIERKFDISQYRKGRIVEIDKLAVLSDKHGTSIAFDLTALVYALARFMGVQKIFIFTLKTNIKNIIFYKKFGFKILGEFELFDSKPAVVMLMDLDSENTYEKKLTHAQLLQIAKNLVNRTVAVDK